MNNLNIGLPAYPCKEDMWDKIAKEKRPIVCYGMGNGADKLIERLQRYGVEIADFFASDGFVRGHSFHGKRVLSYSEVKEKYSDFVILLSFASNRDEVLSLLAKVNSENEMYIPDMPVAGEEYFDKDFYNNNYARIIDAFNVLCDEQSKETFASVINYKLFGKMDYLENAYCTRDELYEILPCEKIQNIVDAGAYNGDTLREAKLYFNNLKTALAIEPDKRNFKKLTKYTEAESDFLIKAENAAVWCDSGFGVFSASGNRNSTLAATASFEHSDGEVRLASIDSLADCRIDYIKYDVEGAELEGLSGADRVIRDCRPSMLVSAYHRSRDIFSLVNYISEHYPFYKIYMRRLRCVPAWELDVLAVSK